MKELINVFRYDQESGKFFWLITPTNNKASAGDEAGSIKSKSGYCNLRYKGKDYLAHRAAWFFVHGRLPTNQIDHINRNRSDNRIENLRECTPSQNQKNQSINKKNTSGCSGVTWQASRNKYLVTVCVSGKRMNMGRYSDLHDAVRARKAAEQKFYGEFASSY